MTTQKKDRTRQEQKLKCNNNWMRGPVRKLFSNSQSQSKKEIETQRCWQRCTKHSKTQRHLKIIVLSYISFKCFLSFLVTCWIEVEWEDRGGPELVRDLEALGLEDGRDVLPVEAGIVWYCDTSRNNHKQVWYRLIMHFKNIQVYLSYCNIWYNIGPKIAIQTPDWCRHLTKATWTKHLEA